MAIVIPQRSKYKPRHIVEYVVDNVMRLRSNCNTITHPNTPLQQCYKNRFTLIHEMQRCITPLFRQGFYRQRSGKNRWVGAFHVAQGYNMSEATQLQEDGITWQVNFSRFTICLHKSKAPKRITVQRKGHLLLLSYTWHGRPEYTGLLWAVYNRKRHQWVHGTEDTRLHGKVAACAIPPAWREEPVEVLIGFGKDSTGRGKLRGTHHFSFTQNEATITVYGNVRGTPTHTTPAHPYTVIALYSPPPEETLWIEIAPAQGIAQRIRVQYLME